MDHFIDGRDGEEDLFGMIRSMPLIGEEVGGAPDGSEYLNESGEGIDLGDLNKTLGDFIHLILNHHGTRISKTFDVQDILKDACLFKGTDCCVCTARCFY